MPQELAESQYIRQQAITWANVDIGLCTHNTSLGQNKLK